MSKLIIKWTRSAIGRPAIQERVVRGLGLKKLQDEVIHNDTPQIRGMINAVGHLLTWKEQE